MDWDREKERKAAKNMTVAGSIFGIFFLVVWTAIAPSFMKLFGLGGLALMIYRLIVLLRLSKKEDPKSQPETDPWDRPQQPLPRPEAPAPTGSNHFCPYCGYSLQSDFSYCPNCGRRTRE